MGGWNQPSNTTHVLTHSLTNFRRARERVCTERLWDMWSLWRVLNRAGLHSLGRTWSAFGYGLTWFPETGHLFIWPHPNCIFLTFNNQGYCWIKVFLIKKKCTMYYKAPSDMTVFFFFWVGEKHKIIAMSSQQTEALRKQATSCQSLTVSTCYYVVLHSNPSS